MFLLDDYKYYSFCRKNYRVNSLIDRMQLRIGIDYYPSLPIEGLSGNNLANVGNALYLNNIPFVNQLWKAMNKFGDINHECSINTTNFAVNQRFYDVTNTTSFLSQNEAYPRPDTPVDPLELKKKNTTNNIEEEKEEQKVKSYDIADYKVRNKETAMGMPLYHENMYIGKSVYAINLESMSNDPTVISGVNTKNFTPFELSLRTHPITSQSGTLDKIFDRSRTMFIYCYYDMLLNIKGTSFTILGR